MRLKSTNTMERYSNDMHLRSSEPSPPLILAPAGGVPSFLAALAAGADAIYCGLKEFSARMEAKNFRMAQLASLTRLAREKGTAVYVAVNALLKPGDIEKMLDLLCRLNTEVAPDAIICQDLAVIQLVRQMDFHGQVHLSTLANVSFPTALSILPSLGVDRVVVPRELGVDEIRKMSAACPSGLELEVFIHGALCYAVSGRCYWSSFLGGKSGLRGRCVQPCRRLYTQNFTLVDAKSADLKSDRFFSCRDLSLDVLVKVLRGIPKVRVWKIEGRKKGPHYVYYTVKAYQLLRDHGTDPNAKKSALSLLERALGRPGTHYHFLPQRPQVPMEGALETGSGMVLGTLKGPREKPFLRSREALLPGDVLRVGYEDTPGHFIVRVRRYIPKGAPFVLPGAEHRPGHRRPIKGTVVFLTDRREKALTDQMAVLEKQMPEPIGPTAETKTPSLKRPIPGNIPTSLVQMNVRRMPEDGDSSEEAGVWLSEAALADTTDPARIKTWWWLPPVIWPDDEDRLTRVIQKSLSLGAKTFVLNAPWQRALLPPHGDCMTLRAGPFCNISNALAIQALADMGFSGVFISPELGGEDIRTIPETSVLPLGLIISGLWPLCISRTVSKTLAPGRGFQSPKGESAFTLRHDSDYWTYPNWELDLNPHKPLLIKSGYRMFVRLVEPIPSWVRMKKREGLWNWKTGLA